MRSNHSRAAWACLAILPWGPPALAQPGPQPGTGPGAERLELAGQIELQRLVDLAAQRLAVDVNYEVGLITGSTTIRSAASLTDEQLWDLTNRLLEIRGLTTVRGPGGSFNVVKLADAPALAPVEPAGPPQARPAPGFRSVLVRVTRRPAKEIAEAARASFGKPTGVVTEVGGEGLIRVSDVAPRVEQVLELVRSLDVPTSGVLVEEIPVRNLSAVALAALVGQVAARTEQMAGVKVPGEVLASPGGATVLVVAPGERQAYWRELIARLDQQESVETRTYAPAHFAISDVAQLVRQTIGDGPRLVEDQLTGSLVITATPTQHSAIDDIMTRLAAVPEAVRRPVRAFKVRNRSARDMLTVLESLLAAGALGAAAEEAPEGTARLEDLRRTDAPATLLPGPPGTAPAPHAPIVAPASGVEPPAEGPRPAPAAIADAPASIRSRDQRGRASPARAGPAPDSAPPLSLAADESTSTIIAVGEPRLLDQLGRLIRTLDVRQPQVMLEVLMVSLSDSDALSLGVEIQKELDLEADARGSLASLFGLGLSSPGAPATPGSGFTGLVLSPGNFSVLLRALETLNRGRTVSMPRLLVNNNEAGTFNSILQQPYANTILSNTSTATTFGGTSNAGTQASIRPQIAEGDHLVLEYSISISSFVGSAGGSNLPPPRQENSLESVVTIPDGFTVVLGGLELTSDTSSVSQVPLLGSIPILGEAFKSRDLSTSRSRFFVFIRANVLRNTGFEDLKHLGTVAAQDAGVGDGWPEVGARVIR